jgi:hypothetical protein
MSILSVRMLDLHLLRVFVPLVTKRNLTRAARSGDGVEPTPPT